jgi:hypothetical protein
VAGPITSLASVKIATLAACANTPHKNLNVRYAPRFGITASPTCMAAASPQVINPVRRRPNLA